MNFASIIVDISHEKLDKTFQYVIPKELEASIKAGELVEVPFGNGNRLIKGYVVEINDIPQFPVEKMKEIHAIIDKGIPIEGHLIQLAAWIRDNYGSTMNQALKTVIPIKKKVTQKEKKYIRLATDPETSIQWLDTFLSKKNTTARARLLSELIREQELPWEIVTDKLNVSVSTIKGLEKLEIIKIVKETIYRNPIKIKNRERFSKVLNEEQQSVATAICESIERREVNTHLIHGITGSGKTEVYMEIIEKTLIMGKEVIVLIPEIALTYQTVIRFYQRFGDEIAIINSRLSAGERYDQFRRAREGQIKIMIGPRSALFTPFQHLGLIIIDEEHESAYKSESVPKYHTRETAIERARMIGGTVILGSATPSVDAYYKALKGEYRLYKLNRKAVASEPPNVNIVDLREELQSGNKSIFSRKLHELIQDRLNKKQQVMLFINRRGYAGFVSCRACGEAIKCPHCDVSLTVHNNGKLICHYCGYEIVMPKGCPKCSSKYISAFGTGTQKVENLTKKEFSDARILRMDMDTTKNKDGHEKILSAFANGEADILIGTQMIVKGHDFHNVTLVGVIAADLSLYASDFKAAERTFQLLTQAAGRAGRGFEKGEVIIQTYCPDHYSIEAASAQDYEKFYEQEITYRTLMKYPPVYNLMAILIASANQEHNNNGAMLISQLISRNNNELQMIGPSDASVSKINDIYRKVIYLKAKDYNRLVKVKNLIEIAVENSHKFKDISIQFDFTPMNNY